MMSTIVHRFPSGEHASLPEPEQILSALRTPQDPGLLATLGDAFVPSSIAAELCASPCSLRAGLLGLEQGRALTFHERRVRLPIARGLEPEVPVWSHGDLPSFWQEGVLQEPKYYSFFVDAPLPAYNTNYRGKWRSHELLHGAVGFCWRPDFSRFEAYLAARLAELLPVVHWYGWDEAFRARCPLHAHRADPPLIECAACEQLASQQPYWARAWNSSDESHALASITRAVAHFEQEWQACMDELEQGVPHPTLYKNLNASRDAMGYVRGHWPRQSAWSFGAWVEMCLVAGDDYDLHLSDYAARVLAQSHRMVSGEIALEANDYARKRHRRAVHDLVYRVLYMCDEMRESPAATARLNQDVMSALESLAQRSREGATSREQLDDLISRVRSCADVLPSGYAEAVLAVGHDFFACDPPDAESSQLIEGIASGATTLMWAIQGAEREPEEVFDGFAQSAHFARGGTLIARASAWLQEQDEPDFAELAAFEAFLLAMPRRDEHADAFAMPVEDLDIIWGAPHRLFVHRTVKRATFRAVILEAVFEQSFSEDLNQELDVLRVIDAEGELQIVLCTPEMGELLDADRTSPGLEGDEEALRALLETGVMWWGGGVKA